MKKPVLPLKTQVGRGRTAAKGRTNPLLKGMTRMNTKKTDMRMEMPKTAAFIDDLRAGFGREYIDNIIRRGMRGEPVFCAEENGHTIGTKVPQGVAVCTDEKGMRFVNHNFGKSGT